MLWLGHRRMSLAVERFIDGELAQEQTSAVAAHLQRCPRCRELAQLLGHLKRALRRRTRPRLVARGSAAPLRAARC
jgi:anti-sigma factor RsiW